MNNIYTIGYEGKTLDEFIKLLLESSINHLVDVRSIAKSARPGFGGQELKEKLFSKSIMYVHKPELGGMVEDDYHTVMEKDSWKKAYEGLKSIAKDIPTAIMCLEKDPMKCHRRHISERLEEEGWEVIHIGKGGSWKDKRLDDYIE